MVKVYDVYLYLRSFLQKDDFTILLCKDFLEKNPLSWVKVEGDYLATDDDGRDYICISSSADGRGWEVKKGFHLNDDIYLLDSRANTLHLSDAFEFANEVLLKRYFCVNPHSFTKGES